MGFVELAAVGGGGGVDPETELVDGDMMVVPQGSLIRLADWEM